MKHHNTAPFAADVTIPSDPAEAAVPGRDRAPAAARQASEHDVFSIRLALEEALVNAIKHGNQMDRAKSAIVISYRASSDRFDVHITDEGSGFDPSDVPDPTAIENLERPCGRGLMLMRHYMTMSPSTTAATPFQCASLRIAKVT